MNSIKVRITLAILLISAGVIATLGPLDNKGYDYTQAGLQRALATFAISRTLNGVISVAQGTEVAVEPVGIGMTFTPGQILDPINDLVERFSTVVLVAGTAFGAQHVLLDVTASSVFAWALWISVSLALLVLLLWNKTNLTLRTVIVRFAVTLAFLRLAVPLFAIAGEAFYLHFLDPQYQQSSAQLKSTTERLSVLNEESKVSVSGATSNKSFFDSAKDWVQNAGTALDWKAHLAEFSEAAEAASEHAIRLMVVFLFQTLLLPLLAIWLTFKTCRACLTSLNFEARDRALYAETSVANKA